MKESLLRPQYPPYHLQGSIYTNTTYEKATYGLSTVNMSQSKISEQENDDSLSQIIINFQKFWFKRSDNQQQQSIKNVLNLDINSVISRSSKNNSLNDLTAKSKPAHNEKIFFDRISNKSRTLPKIKKSSSFSKPKQLSIDSNSMNSLKQISYINFSKKSLKQSEQIQKISLQSINKPSINIFPKQEHKICPKVQTPLVIQDYFYYLNSLSMVGIFCSEYLVNTNIRWKTISILLYIQSYNQLIELGIDFDGKIDSPPWIDKKFGRLDMIQDFNKIAQEFSGYENSAQKFKIMINQSKKTIEDILGLDMNPFYQFCMHHIILTLAMLASAYGMSIPDLEFVDAPSQINPQIIKRNLLLYKQILSFSQNL